jgi:hypothetical protein
MGFQKEGDVGVGIVVFVQMELLSERGGISFGVEEFAKYALRTASNEDAKGKDGSEPAA